MKKIKYLLTIAIAVVSMEVLTFHNSLMAQQLGTKRTDLQKHDLSVPGFEVLQATIEFTPGLEAPGHTHPGEEIIYVVEGVLEYKVGEEPPVVLKAGEVLFVPAGVVHSAKNVGTGNAIELATYVLEKGKPLITIVK
ncbi:MAG: cupin domain-containing protein [Ignavibacteria bacterium]|nr:cupin domain-containing protein [Ignavibacteria bacterium]